MGCKDAALPEFLREKSYSQLPYLRKEHQKTIQRQFLPLQSTCSPLAWKTDKSKNIKFIQSLPYNQYKP